MFERIVPEGVEWGDGRSMAADTLLWATGFRPAIDHLAPLRLRGSGGGIRMDGTRVVADPRIHLVGYGPSASTIGANRAGRTAARDVRRLLEGTAASGSTPRRQTAVDEAAASGDSDQNRIGGPLDRVAAQDSAPR
jgi:pyruvate/2-oxoglutarate dehydrogenase complex dihydrolipoamide dehydrogenase (E3) component